MLFSDFLYRGAHHFQKQFVNAAGIPVFPEQGVPQPVQALDYEGGFLRRICDKVFLFFHLACLLCASIIYGGEDSRKCAIFRLGLSHEAPTLLDFFGEIYSSAAKNLDFMRVCESVVMNIGTRLSLDAIRVPSSAFSFAFSLTLAAGSFSSTLTGGELPLPNRELHLCGVRGFSCPRFPLASLLHNSGGAPLRDSIV